MINREPGGRDGAAIQPHFELECSGVLLHSDDGCTSLLLSRAAGLHRSAAIPVRRRKHSDQVRHSGTIHSDT